MRALRYAPSTKATKRKAHVMKEYRLGSSSMVSAPGLIRWAINGAKFKKDRATMVNIVAQTWSIPEDAALALLTERASFKVENEAVVFRA